MYKPYMVVGPHNGRGRSLGDEPHDLSQQVETEESLEAVQVQEMPAMLNGKLKFLRVWF